MTLRTILLCLGILMFSTELSAQVSEDEVRHLREQIELLTRRLDELEARNRQMTEEIALTEKVAAEQTGARAEEQLAAVSWTERIRWKGDFRYRYENIEIEDLDSRNRSRIRARAHLEAELSPTLEVGMGLATGGDDPVSSNQTIGGGGSSKEIKFDLAYFDWSGLPDTNILGGKFKNYLIRPANKGLMWDSDWRPEGLGAIWDNDRFFVQGLGTWLEGDSKLGTEFAWAVQAGMKFRFGETGRLKFGAGYSVFDIAGRTPLFGDPEDFYGNSFVLNPVTRKLVFKYNYHNIEAFAEYAFELGGKPVLLFADYTVNQEAPQNDKGYLVGARYGSAKHRGQWDITYFYERLEKDANVGLLADSNFGGGGTDAKGHALSGTYAFHPKWNIKATWYMNQIHLEQPLDYDRFMLDLNFKYE